MQETQFVVLMHAGAYVDETLLHDGIYTTLIPRIRDKNTTIEGLIDAIRNFPGRAKVGWEDSMIENLKKCTLTPVELKF